MLREILRDSLDELLLTIQKIGKSFELVQGKYVEAEDINQIKRMIHSLKGSLQSIGMHNEVLIAIELEEEIFRFFNNENRKGIYIGKEDINSWFTRLNSIEFSLKGYLF
jgi:chemotaxis protein histidine kinase CheA